MNEEIWMPINGYEGLYEVSSLGRVKSLARVFKHTARNSHKETAAYLKERILQPQQDNCGYLHVRLSRDGKQYLSKVHVLVAEAFLGYDRTAYDRKNIDDSLVVDHLNRD